MKREKFISLQRLAQELGLPAAWLKAEAEAGRIPCLRAGRRLLFNAEAVEKTLIERANDLPGAPREEASDATV